MENRLSFGSPRQLESALRISRIEIFILLNFWKMLRLRSGKLMRLAWAHSRHLNSLRPNAITVKYSLASENVFHPSFEETRNDRAFILQMNVMREYLLADTAV